MPKFAGILLAVFISVFATCANAADMPNLQNTVERYDPGKTAVDLSTQNELDKDVHQPPNVVNIQTKPAAPSKNDASVNIKFKLKKIVLVGNTVFSTKELSKLYADKLNTDVSLADLELIAQKITDYYRNAGYVLTQAIIPPQEINQDGIVKIKIIEGFVNKVSVTGCNRANVCALLQKYGEHIARKVPLHIDTLERYSFLADDIPGVKVRAVLTRSQEFARAADLTFIVEEKNYGCSIAYNDYNSKVLGRFQYIANVYVDNLLLASETAINGILSSDTDRMRYASFTHRQQLNSRGLGMRLSVSDIKTDPDMGTIGLGGLVIPGSAFTATASAEYAWIRSHNKNLYVGAGFKFLNSNTTFGGETLFKDNIRSVNAYVQYSYLQSAATYNSLLLTVSQGLNIFDAQGNPPSRVGENIDFTKIDLYASSTHSFSSKFSSVLAVKAQYAFNTVPSSETFVYGGLPFGAGYDPAEFAGDRGVDGLIELQYRALRMPKYKFVSQLFAFFDFGYVWDINNVQPTAQSGASAGVGYRSNLLKHLNLDFIVARPLKPSNIEGTANYTRLLFNVKLYA